MTNLVERIPVDDMRFLATAILLQKESGGNLVQILDKTSAVLRERARLRGQLQNLYCPGQDYRMDPLCRTLPDVWFDQPYEP